MIRLVILDVEGVVTRPGGSQQPWPLDDMLEVRRFLEQSPLAGALCTGRQEPYGEAVIQALNLFQPLPEAARERAYAVSGHALLGWPSVLENGAYLYDPIAKRPIPHPALTSERLRTLRRLQAEVLAPLAADTGAQFEPGKDFCVSINPPLADARTGDREPTEGFRPVVEAALGDYVAEVEIKHSASAVDITPRGVSKASAVRLALEWTGLAPEEVLGVGDTQADAAWLQEVGWRAAPANGREQLPGMHYYAPRDVAEGLLDILRRLRGHDYAGL